MALISVVSQMINNEMVGWYRIASIVNEGLSNLLVRNFADDANHGLNVEDKDACNEPSPTCF